MDVEVIATSKIKGIISRNSYLRAVIDDNDKTPIWDGDVFVYKTKDPNKRVSDSLGRVPVQIKGHKVEKINSDRNEQIKFRVELSHAKKYFEDGGLIFLVVYMNEQQEKVFYNSLLPLDLARLIKKYDHQQSFLIELKILPMEEKNLADIFLDFVQNRKKQLGTLIPEFLYIDDIDKVKNEIEELRFSFSSVEPIEDIPYRELTTRDFYVYAKPKGLGNPIPVDKFTNGVINIQNKLEISVAERVYYDNANTSWVRGKPQIIFGESVKIILDENTKDRLGNMNIKIINKGTLNERLNDLYFLKALIDNNRFSINNQEIEYGSLKSDNISEICDVIDNLERIKERLKYYGVTADLNLDNFTDIDDFSLGLIMEESPPVERYNIDLSEPPLLKLKIANITILLKITEDKENKHYIVKDFFRNELKVRYAFEESSEYIDGSQFLILNKEDLLVDNIDSQMIIRDIQNKYTGDSEIPYINGFLLQVIKAYDKYGKINIELEYLMESLSEWIYEKIGEDYTYINLAQVKYRLNKMSDIDVDRLTNVMNSNKDLEILAGVSILLGDGDEAINIINKMVPEQKEVFMSYPIYNLLKKTGDIT